jgi:hypothetical protein
MMTDMISVLFSLGLQLKGQYLANSRGVSHASTEPDAVSSRMVKSAKARKFR